jgi:DNA polymerase beta
MKKSIIIDEFKILIKKLKNDVSLLEAKGKKDDKKEISAINFKIRNFIKVIKSLENYENNEINKSDDVKELDGIGKGTLTRIDEILSNGLLAEGHQEISNDDTKVTKRIEDLLSVTGIGPARASELNNEGITLDNLLDEYKKLKNDDNYESDILKRLTHHQLIGLKYYKQFQKRIPREKILKIDTKIQKLLNKYLKSKKLDTIHTDIEAIICGSYRRGLSESGDIDLLISSSKEFDLIDFVKFLTEEGLIIDHLTEKGTTKFMGVCDKTGGYRLDIRFIPKESFGAALMYFTGSKNFNTLVRTEALKKGYTLEEYGLYPLIKEKEKEKELETEDKVKLKEKEKEKKKVAHSHQHLKGEKIPCPNEEIIFDILKINKKYLDPTNRNLEENISTL